MSDKTALDLVDDASSRMHEPLHLSWWTISRPSKSWRTPSIMARWNTLISQCIGYGKRFEIATLRSTSFQQTQWSQTSSLRLFLESPSNGIVRLWDSCSPRTLHWGGVLKYNAHVMVTTTFHPSKSFLIVSHLNTMDTRSYLVLTIVPLSYCLFSYCSPIYTSRRPIVLTIYIGR